LHVGWKWGSSFTALRALGKQKEQREFDIRITPSAALEKQEKTSNYTKLSYTMMSPLFAASGLFFLETN